MARLAGGAGARVDGPRRKKPGQGLGRSLYKIFFYFEPFVHVSIVLSFFCPACIAHTVAILLHDYWAIYDPPLDFPFVCHTPCNKPVNQEGLSLNVWPAEQVPG